MVNSTHILLSLVIPAFNEQAIIEKNLGIIHNYMRSFRPDYDWEIILVNDGSKDDTGKLADKFSQRHPNVKVVHHIVNLNLGHALKTGFMHVKGKYTIVLDLDLSYHTNHIE